MANGYQPQSEGEGGGTFVPSQIQGAPDRYQEKAGNDAWRQALAVGASLRR